MNILQPIQVVANEMTYVAQNQNIKRAKYKGVKPNLRESGPAKFHRIASFAPQVQLWLAPRFSVGTKEPTIDSESRGNGAHAPRFSNERKERTI
jgi:hypothetical protein